MGTGSGSIWMMSLSFALLGLDAPNAQTAPLESTSKVKRVLLYNKIGGWYCGACMEKAQEVFFNMAQSKGFSVEATSSAADMTPENLKRFQVIVWNNNSDARASVPDSQARQAVAEYVRQGGGWMLVNLANQTQRTWPFLDSLVGAGTNGWQGASDSAALVADSSAQKHPELRFLIGAMPATIPLRMNWLSVYDPTTEFDQLKTIYRVKNAAWVTASSNLISDRYIWAGTRDKGKALCIPLGWPDVFGTKDIMAQADSAVPKLYWQGLRWLAGDFQNGCINPVMPNFNPEARVDDGTCALLGMRGNRRQERTLVKISGRRMRFSPHVSGGSRLRLLDLRGHPIWKSTVPGAAGAFDLPESISGGLYILESTGANMSFQARILVP